MPGDNSQYWVGKESVYESWEKADRGGRGKPTPSGGKKRVLDILFIVDVSGSMEGPRIEQVNRAMGNIFGKLLQRDALRPIVRVGVMAFSDTARWLTARPAPLDKYAFTPLKAEPWYTCYSKAFLALEEKLHTAAFMAPEDGEHIPPLILFISDGEPVDVGEYPAALEALKQNRWFRKSAKYAVAVGPESRDPEVIRTLARFAGPVENVRYADGGGGSLSRLVEHIALRASEVQASGGVSGEGSIFMKRDESLFDSMFDKGR